MARELCVKTEQLILAEDQIAQQMVRPPREEENVCFFPFPFHLLDDGAGYLWRNLECLILPRFMLQMAPVAPASEKPMDSASPSWQRCSQAVPSERLPLHSKDGECTVDGPLCSLSFSLPSDDRVGSRPWPFPVECLPEISRKHLGLDLSTTGPASPRIVAGPGWRNRHHLHLSQWGDMSPLA